LQADEIWSFVGKKEKNTDAGDKACGMGDAWVWTGIDADSKLIVSYLVGQRTADCAATFITDLARRLANRVQLSTDGLKVYVDAVENAFGADVDFGQLVKSYTATIEGQKRYSPAQCCGAQKTPISGNPDSKHISTSYSERLNLTIRMQDRRFTRLTNAFSKKLENHVASVHLHNFYYNFCRMHKSLRMTPAMAAGITDRLWNMEDVVAMVEAKEAAAAQPKPSGLVPVRR
jgi:IS1 family transposase